jgi:peptidoglycan/xylan/chitin deacetylase (PgdA/CDA1 family)
VPSALITIPAAVTAATALTTYAARYPSAQLLGHVTAQTNSPRKLAITFDDGPNPSITLKLLDLLDLHKTRATFFVIGQYATQHPDLLRETIARGHQIGNHTHTHPNLFWSSPTQTRDELTRCNDAISAALHASPSPSPTPPTRWFRPPFGWRNPWLASAARTLNLQVVTWTLLPGDWRAPTDAWLIHRIRPIAARFERAQHRPVVRNTAGDILCLHDGNHRAQNADRTHTLAALEHWLPRWRDAGLEFVTMDQAVSTPA